jgi:hypothetical protein
VAPSKNVTVEQSAQMADFPVVAKNGGCAGGRRVPWNRPLRERSHRGSSVGRHDPYVTDNAAGESDEEIEGVPSGV